MSDTYTVYVADPDQLPSLKAELAGIGDVEQVAPDLFRHRGPACPMAWSMNTWFDAREIPFTSVGDAVAKLRELGGWWGLHPGASYRRSQLIAERLLTPKPKPHTFPPSRKHRALGAFTLLDEHTLLAAPATERPFPSGMLSLEENRDGPPSRAYKKIQEMLTLLGHWPGEGDLCLDLGSSPGAWTWTLAKLGSRVHSYDKAPLDPEVDAMELVTHHQSSAFAIDPAESPATWVFSDIICYPGRLHGFMERWLEKSTCQNFGITVKCQGPKDTESVKLFQSLPGRVVHLSHNKHEVTWLHVPGLKEVGPWPWLTAPQR